jgi:hypothetical protein
MFAFVQQANLAPSYITEAIRAGAPKFGIQPDKKVTPLRR